MSTTYPAPNSVSLLPLVKVHNGQALSAEFDGEFVYASLEFATSSDRALFLSDLRDIFPAVDTDIIPGCYSAVSLGTVALGIAFPASDYYL